MKRRWFIVSFLLLSLLLTGCAGGGELVAPPLREPAGMEQDIVSVTRGSISRLQTHSGLVLPEVLELAFTVPGPITEVLVSVGSQVEAGEPLVKLNTASLETALESAKSQLAYTESEYELNLHKRELQLEIARLELEELKSYGASSTARKLKEVQIEEQENQLAEFTGLWELNRAEQARSIGELEKQITAGVLTAPCAGTVVFCSAAEGSYAMVNTPVLWLAKADSVTIRTDYLAVDKVNKASDLYAMVDGYRVDVEYVPMDRKEFLAMKASGDTMYSVFRVRDAHGAQVKAGMEVVLFLASDHAEDALILPANAVRRDSTGFYVYRVTPEGQQRQSVSRGIFTDALVQITSGLEEGEQVYVGN